jgi:hypothetical protein
MPQQMAILLDFIKVNRLRLVDWFFQFDKDHSGDISREEFKTGLKETGLKMTQVGHLHNISVVLWCTSLSHLENIAVVMIYGLR